MKIYTKCGSWKVELFKCHTSRLHVCFHGLCVQDSMCTPINIMNQHRRTILTYSESFVMIWLYLAELWGFVHCSECMQVFRCCACMHACACPWILSINSGDQPWHTLKVLWRSYFIWLRYEGFGYFPKVCVHIFMLCACTHASAPPWPLLISTWDQSWHTLTALCWSDFIWLSYEGLFIAPSCMYVLRRSDFIWLRYEGFFTSLSCVHRFTRCACMHACAHPWT